MTTTDAQISDLIKRIVSVCQPLRIILFGSAARGDMGENSDLDLLVVVPNDTHRRNTMRDVYRALIGFGVAADVIVATPEDLARAAASLVYSRALVEGKEIYHAAA